MGKDAADYYLRRTRRALRSRHSASRRHLQHSDGGGSGQRRERDHDAGPGQATVDSVRRACADVRRFSMDHAWQGTEFNVGPLLDTEDGARAFLRSGKAIPERSCKHVAFVQRLPDGSSAADGRTGPAIVTIAAIGGSEDTKRDE